MRRIGIEAQRIFRKDKHGMDMVVINQIKTLMSLCPEGFEFVIFTNGKNEQDDWPEHPQFSWRNHESSYPVWEQVWLPKVVKEENIDLLHCTSNTAPVNCPVELGVTVHDIIYYDIYPLTAPGFTPYQRFGNMYRRWNVKRVMKKAKWVASVSSFESERMVAKFPFLEGKMHTLYNAVSSTFKPADESSVVNLRNSYDITDPFFLFLGNTDPKKNTAGALKAFAKALESQSDLLMVVADLDRDFVTGILGNRAGEVMKRIRAVGYIPNEEMHIWMSAARFFLYPSLRESFGIPILEGMASGCPVITSTTTSMPEVSGGAALLVDPRNVDEMANAIDRLWKDEGMRVDLIEKGINRAKEFSWEANVQDLLKLYADER